MKKLKYVLFIFILGLTVSLTTMCRDSSSGNGDDTGELTYTEQEIGPGGGIIENESGAKLTVPAGALHETVTIRLASYDTYGQLADSFGVNHLNGCVSLKPDGLTFSVPATLEIPLFSSRTPGDEYALFVYNEEEESWYQETNPGVVTQDGLKLQAQIEHFTFSSASSIKGKGLAEFIDEYENPAQTTQEAFDNFKNNFINNNNIFSWKRQTGDTCYKVCGIRFDIMTHYAGYEDQFIELTGEQSGTVTYLNYHYDKMVSEGSLEYQIIYDIKAYIYWKEVECEEVCWSGTLNYEQYYEQANWYSMEASYSVNFNFTVLDDYFIVIEDELYNAIEGIATATQDDVSVTSLDEDEWVENVNAPSILELIVYGYVEDGYLQMTISKQDESPFFTFILGELDDGEVTYFNFEGFIWMYTRGDIPLSEGTYEGSWDYSDVGGSIASYTITLQRDDL
jgi:hypothetical protein